MTHRHKARPNTMIGRTRIEGGRGSRLIGTVKHPAETGSRFIVYFLRFEGANAATDPNVSATGWAEWWPRNPVELLSHKEAVDAAKATLPLLVGEPDPARFERRPYQLPVRPEGVKKITPEGSRLRASIVRWPDGRYEVRYFAYLLLGTWPDGSEEWDWVRYGHQRATLADTLDEARAIALAEIAAMANDPALRQRFNPNTLFPNP